MLKKIKYAIIECRKKSECKCQFFLNYSACHNQSWLHLSILYLRCPLMKNIKNILNVTYSLRLFQYTQNSLKIPLRSNYATFYQKTVSVVGEICQIVDTATVIGILIVLDRLAVMRGHNILQRTSKVKLIPYQAVLGSGGSWFLGLGFVWKLAKCRNRRNSS